MSGEGVYYFSDGATLSGVFKKGKLKDGTFCYTDENGEYKVKIKNYKYSKKITATFLNGDMIRFLVSVKYFTIQEISMKEK